MNRNFMNLFTSFPIYCISKLLKFWLNQSKCKPNQIKESSLYTIERGLDNVLAVINFALNQKEILSRRLCLPRYSTRPYLSITEMAENIRTMNNN